MKEKKIEICVSCGKETKIDKDQPISNRMLYVEGCGQLCYKCYREIFGKNIADKPGV